RAAPLRHRGVRRRPELRRDRPRHRDRDARRGRHATRAAHPRDGGHGRRRDPRIDLALSPRRARMDEAEARAGLSGTDAPQPTSAHMVLAVLAGYAAMVVAVVLVLVAAGLAFGDGLSGTLRDIREILPHMLRVAGLPALGVAFLLGIVTHHLLV